MTASHEQRISRLEGALEQLSARLDEMNGRINTLMILVCGSWVTLMGAIITLFFTQ